LYVECTPPASWAATTSRPGLAAVWRQLYNATSAWFGLMAGGDRRAVGGGQPEGRARRRARLPLKNRKHFNRAWHMPIYLVRGRHMSSARASTASFSCARVSSGQRLMSSATSRRETSKRRESSFFQPRQFCVLCARGWTEQDKTLGILGAYPVLPRTRAKMRRTEKRAGPFPGTFSLSIVARPFASLHRC